ncbi:phage tail tape measure protein [Egicoccus sp. AB-alg2]
MNEVFTLLPGASADAMGKMEKDVRKFAVEMGVTTDKVVPALYQSLSAGVPPDNVFAFLEVAQKAAVGGVTQLETAVDGITSVVNAYGAEVMDAGRASDLMFTAVRLGKTNFEELSGSLYNVLPTASALGVGFEDITAAMAQMTAQGVPTSVATTQMRQLLVELSKEGGKASDSFKEIAGVGFAEFIAQGGNVADALDIMQQAADNNGVALQDMFGSVEAGNAALALASDGTDDYRAALAEMAESAGATEQAYDQMNQGLERARERIGALWGELKLQVGELLAPYIQAAAESMIESIMSFVTGWQQGATEVGRNVNEIIGGAQAMGSQAREAFDTVKTWWDENGPVIRERFQQVMDKSVEMGQALKVWWTETAKPAVDEFLAVISEHWPRIEGIWNNLATVVTAAGDVISNVLELMRREHDVTADTADAAAGRTVTSFERLVGAGEWASSNLSTSMEVLAGAIDRDSDRVIRALHNATDGGFTRFTTESARQMVLFKRDIEERVGEVVGFFRALPGRIVAAFGNAGDLLRGIGRQIIDGLTAGMRDAWSNARDWLSGLGGQIRNLKGPIEKDRVLLTDIGREIIGGLGRGMEDEWRQVERLLGTMTAEIPLTVDAGAVAAAAGGRVPGAVLGGERVIEVHHHQPIHVTGTMMDPEGVVRALETATRRSRREFGPVV